MQRLPTTLKFDNQSLFPARATCPCGSLVGCAPHRPPVSQAAGGLVLWGAGSPETAFSSSPRRAHRGLEAPYRTYTLRPEVSTSLLLTCRWQQQTLMSIVVSATPPRGGFSPKAKLENLIKELLMLAVFSFQLQRRFNSRHIRYHKWIQPATDTVRRVSKHERNHVIISAVTVAGTVSVRTDCSSRRGRTQLTANPCS